MRCTSSPQGSGPGRQSPVQAPGLRGREERELRLRAEENYKLGEPSCWKGQSPLPGGLKGAQKQDKVPSGPGQLAFRINITSSTGTALKSASKLAYLTRDLP